MPGISLGIRGANQNTCAPRLLNPNHSQAEILSNFHASFVLLLFAWKSITPMEILLRRV